MHQIIDIMQTMLKTTFVLVVDDRAADRETLRAVLEDSGYAVSEGQDGKQAIAKSRKDATVSSCWTYGCPAWTDSLL